MTRRGARRGRRRRAAGAGSASGAGGLDTTGLWAGVMVWGLPVLTLPLPRLATYVGALGRYAGAAT
jgi:hypothetical protein